eukprot:1161573-Pelagomonas_calceolata.AAC.4
MQAELLRHSGNRQMGSWDHASRDHAGRAPRHLGRTDRGRASSDLSKCMLAHLCCSNMLATIVESCITDLKMLVVCIQEGVDVSWGASTWLLPPAPTAQGDGICGHWSSEMRFGMTIADFLAH